MTALRLSNQGQRLDIQGDMTLSDVPALLNALPTYAGITQVDLSGVDRVDSSALTFLLALSRAAGGNTVQVQHAPPALRALNDLYGLQTLFWVV